jgi:ubiquinone/menaquinone biosynthesis C-methylase UbiE
MKHYDQTAKVYDKQYEEEQNAKIDAALESLTPTNNAIILDAGCGTGLLFKRVAVHAKLIIGIDTSLKLLKQAKNKIKTFNNIMLIQADADHMPFPDESFTVTFAFTLLQNMPKPNTTLEEIKRITSQNASTIVTGLKKNFSQESFTQLLENARLEIVNMKTDEKLKDFVAVCRKH